MLANDRLERIIVEHDPDDLFDADDTEEEVDRDGIASEYAVNLSFHLGETFNPISVEVTPIADLPEPRISIEPCPTDPAAADRVRTAIRTAIDSHAQRGAFRDSKE